MNFQITFSSVLTMLLFALPGFLICKAKKTTVDHLPGISAVLVYICSPALVFSSFMSMEYRKEDLFGMLLFFLVTLVLQSVFMFGLYLLLRKKYENPKYRMLTLCSVIGNVSFFGLPVVRALLPNNPEVMCYSCVFSTSMNILIFLVGIYLLTNEKKYLKFSSAFLNPTTLSTLAALPLYIFGASSFVPSLMLDGLSLLGKMTTPLCMLILGVRLASIDIKKLFTRPFVYLVCLMKLVVFPLFCFAAVYFLPIDNAFKLCIFILSATPCASNSLTFAEMFGGETELAANCMILSTIASLLTLPVLSYIFG